MSRPGARLRPQGRAPPPGRCPRRPAVALARAAGVRPDLRSAAGGHPGRRGRGGGRTGRARSAASISRLRRRRPPGRRPPDYPGVHRARLRAGPGRASLTVNPAARRRGQVLDLGHGDTRTRRDGVAGSGSGPAGGRPRARRDLPGPRRERTGRRRRGPGRRGPAPGGRLRRGARPRLGCGDRGFLAARNGPRRPGRPGRPGGTLDVRLLGQRLRVVRGRRRGRVRADARAARRRRSGHRALRRGEGGVRAGDGRSGRRPSADRAPG